MDKDFKARISLPHTCDHDEDEFINNKIAVHVDYVFKKMGDAEDFVERLERNNGLALDESVGEDEVMATGLFFSQLLAKALAVMSTDMIEEVRQHGYKKHGSEFVDYAISQGLHAGSMLEFKENRSKKKEDDLEWFKQQMEGEN